MEALSIHCPGLIEVGQGSGEREFAIPLQAAEHDAEDGEGHAAELVIVAVAMNAFDEVGLGDARR